MKPQLIKLTIHKPVEDMQYVWINANVITCILRSDNGYTDIHTVGDGTSLARVKETPEEIIKVINGIYVSPSTDNKGIPR